MNKELEEAKDILRNIKDDIDWDCKENIEIRNAIDTVLQALENSIPKEKVEKIIKDLDEEFYTLDKEININKYGLDDRGKIFAMQEIGWTKGKLEELLEGK